MTFRALAFVLALGLLVVPAVATTIDLPALSPVGEAAAMKVPDQFLCVRVSSDSREVCAWDADA